ncbi:MAG: sensor histidine kinase, partial [Oceanihabitans sp.]
MNVQKQPFFYTFTFVLHSNSLKLTLFVKTLLIALVLNTLVGCSKKQSTIQQINSPINDNVALLIKTKELLKAQELNKTIQNDSLKAKNYLKIAFKALNSTDSTIYKTANRLAYNLSLKLEDTLGQAETHWNEGAFQSRKEQLDSAYFHFIKAYKLYDAVENNNYAAKMLFNMAFIESRLADYVNAEAKLFQAISKYEKLDKSLSLYKCYKLLGTVYKDTEEYENSIIYHNKALESLKKIDNKHFQKEALLNDIALTMQLQGTYLKSISTFNNALNNKQLPKKNPLLYSKIMDNRAYTKLLNGDTTSVFKDFKLALKIRDSLNDLSGIVINKLHVAEYFIAKKDIVKATQFALDAKKLASETQNNRDLMASLLLLSKTDSKNASTHLSEYISLTNKTDRQERLFKNKFARIRFETDYYIDKSEKLSLQKVYLIILVFILFFIFILFYILIVQRAKTKELSLKAKQQEANEDIYKLMLKQQSKLEEGRLKERNRISEELHDGVLGKIFGARMGLGFLSLKGDATTLKKHQLFIDELLDIEQEIRTISHDLKNEILLSKRDYISLITSFLERHCEINNLKFKINIDESSYWNDSSHAIKINCYRIVQESLYNIIKHAKATFVELDFDYQDNYLKLTITDNG